MSKRHVGRKYGKNKIKCAQYAAEHRRVKNGPKLKLGINGQVIQTPRTQRNPERAPHRFR